MTLKELAEMFGMSKAAMKKQIEGIEGIKFIKGKRKRYYSPREVRIIKDDLE